MLDVALARKLIERVIEPSTVLSPADHFPVDRLSDADHKTVRGILVCSARIGADKSFLSDAIAMVEMPHPAVIGPTRFLCGRFLGWKLAIVIICIEKGSRRELLGVVQASRFLRRNPRFLQCRQQHGSQNRNDCNNY